MLTTKTLSSSAQSPMLPDVTIARQNIKNGLFSTYSSSFIVTNEDLRSAFKFMQKNTKNALVCAASGDHPIFATLHGAKNVDTFDISYNAKIIMDIKTAAIRTITYGQYKKLLRDMYWNKDLESIDNMSKIIPQLPQIEQTYITGMRGSELCRYGLHPDDYEVSTFLSSVEFYKARKKLPQSFNFIWSDIYELGEKLTKSYDFMHLSNIFDYTSRCDTVNILRSLVKHTHPGSIICMECLYPRDHSKKYFDDIFETIAVLNKKDRWCFVTNERESTVLYVMYRGQR